MGTDVEIWRTALKLIQDCGSHANPKEIAFGKSSECHAQGRTMDAVRWAEIATAVGEILEGPTGVSLASTCLQ